MQKIIVHGFVMLAKLQDGKSYLMKEKEDRFEFFTPRSRDLVVAHRKESVQPWIKESGKQNNFIELMKYN
jgi:hypothetical protein